MIGANDRNDLPLSLVQFPTFQKMNVIDKRFQIERELGKGSFGKVVLAFDHQLNCQVSNSKY
jgi:hypothetical protein